MIGFVELSRAGQIVNNSTFEPFVIFAAVGAIGVAAVFPPAFLSPAMGYVIDRFPRERVLTAMLLLRFVSLIAAVIIPWGDFTFKMAVIIIAVSLIEVSIAKMRLFRAVDFLSFAFVISIMAVIVSAAGY